MATLMNVIDNNMIIGYPCSVATERGSRKMTPKEIRSNLTVEWLRENLIYEPDVGVFLWKTRGPGRMMGKVLGSKNWDGYLAMKVAGTLYYAHRLAWLYVHGIWPGSAIDHIDGDRSNNAIGNLRLATHSQNAARKKSHRRIAPARGVMPQGPGFVARLYHGGKRHYLGYFSTVQAASAAYEAKAREIHGQFAHVDSPSTWDMETAAAQRRSPQRDWLLVATPGFGATLNG